MGLGVCYAGLRKEFHDYDVNIHGTSVVPTTTRVLSHLGAFYAGLRCGTYGTFCYGIA